MLCEKDVVITMADIIETVLAAKGIKDLVDDKPVVSAKDPDVTADKVEAAIAKLKSIEANGGYLRIAQSCDLTQAQVQEIHIKMLAKIAELKAWGEVEGVKP